MTKYSDHDLELILKACLTDELEKIEVPPVEEQLAKFKAHYSFQRRIVPERRLHRVAAAAVLILAVISGILFSTASEATAFGEKIVKTFRTIVGKTTENKTTVVTRPMSAGTPQAGEAQVAVNARELSMEDAQKLVPVQIAKPQYLPPNMVQGKLTLTEISRDLFSISIQYQLDGRYVTFVQRNQPGNGSDSLLYDTDDATLRNIEINGSPGYELTTKNGSHTIAWSTRGLSLQLIGKLPEDELLKMAESVR